jgi:GTP-binding protein
VKFLDEVEIQVSSGSGGDGCVSFHRERFRPKGAPDGGDGGRGGAVIFEATRSRNTLIDFRRKRHYTAPNGRPGMGGRKKGPDADDIRCLVPVGTVVYDAETGAKLADLREHGATWRLPGGRGGMGNLNFATATRQGPDFATPPQPGIALVLRLELKLIADVGLLGFPNAGKSTFLTRVSAATPKVAAYPFTTITPHLGVVEGAPGDTFVIADLPGLIEGAADGAGLGHQFLKHVERCALYLHLVSVDPEDGDPVERFLTLNGELRRYRRRVAERPQIVVLSKTDLLPADELDTLRERMEAACGGTVFTLSSATGAGLRELVKQIAGALYTLRSLRAELGDEEEE